jgi:hypothetical protein
MSHGPGTTAFQSKASQFTITSYTQYHCTLNSMRRWGSRSAKVSDPVTVDDPIEEWTNVVRVKLFSCDIIPVITDGRRLGSTVPDVGNEGPQDSSMARSDGSGIHISCDESGILDIRLNQRSQVFNVL